jgi:hypothetical protein
MNKSQGIIIWVVFAILAIFFFGLCGIAFGFLLTSIIWLSAGIIIISTIFLVLRSERKNNS